jgi:hypothetical protein
VESFSEILLYGTNRASGSKYNQDSSDESDKDEEFDIYKIKDLLPFAPEKKRKKLSEEKKISDVYKEKKNTIEMKDLISSIDQKEAKVLGSEAYSKLKENLGSLNKIEKEKKKGDVFEVVDDYVLKKNEKRAAYDLIDEKMLRWKPIVDHLTENKKVPIFYKENNEKRDHSNHQSTELGKKNEFDLSLDANVEKNEPYRTLNEMKDPLKLSKEEVIKRSKEIAQHRKMMHNQQVKLSRIKRIKSKA